MALTAMAILGVVAYTRLPAELNPRVDIPTLTVTTIYPGAGPREVEALVTRPLEDAAGAVGEAHEHGAVVVEQAAGHHDVVVCAKFINRIAGDVFGEVFGVRMLS